MAVKRANTTRRSGSSAAVGKTAKSAASKVSKRPAAKPMGKSSRPAKAGQTGKASGGARAAKATTAKKSAAPASRARAAVTKLPKPLTGTAQVVKVVEGALDEMKAVQVKVLDVRKLTDIADTLIIASGNSDRHVRSIAERVVEHAKKAGLRAVGVEGQRDGEWVLVDLQDVIVHVMLPRIRELYRLENLWDVSAARREATLEKMAV